MNNAVLGKYVPGNSFVHRLDPRYKFVIMIILMIAAFWRSSGYLGLFFVYLFVIIAIINAKIKVSKILKMIKYMLFMITLLFIINLFTMQSGLIIYNLNKIIPSINFPIYLKPIVETLYILLRLILMISISFILTTTTKPMEMTYAIEALLKPLKKIRFPVHEVAMIISIALRFIPTLFEEAERIMKAQASRGIDIREGKLKEKIIALTSLIIPLFVSAFQRSEELADAMEARGYDPSGKRTRYRILKSSTKDVVVLLAGLSVLTITILFGVFQQEVLEVIKIW